MTSARTDAEAVVEPAITLISTYVRRGTPIPPIIEVDHDHPLKIWQEGAVATAARVAAPRKRPVRRPWQCPSAMEKCCPSGLASPASPIFQLSGYEIERGRAGRFTVPFGCVGVS